MEDETNPEDFAHFRASIEASVRNLKDRLDALEHPVTTSSGVKRFDLIEKCLKGVMEADKQLDDKAGRILAAMAFLTAAAGAIYSKVQLGCKIQESFLPRMEASFLAFWAYLLFMLIGVMLYLFVLEPGLVISPDKERESRKPLKTKQGPFASSTFYYYIPNVPKDKWIRYWTKKEAEKLEKRMQFDNAREGYLVSIRARHKVWFMNSGIFAFHLAISFLVPLVACLYSKDYRVVRSWTLAGWSALSLVYIPGEWIWTSGWGSSRRRLRLTIGRAAISLFFLALLWNFH